jgi:Family of unknown function (DUF6082)
VSLRILQRGDAAGHTARRVGLLLALLVVMLAVVSLVLLSPVALAVLNPDGRADWERLANISQTYAAASAVLALLALGGVAASLVFQAREMRMSRSQALRSHHFELLRMAMENPSYMRVWGPSRFPDDEQWRQALYANLIVTYWYMAYDMGDLSEIHLRAVAAEFFAGEPGQDFWRTWRELRLRTATQKAVRNFNQILDDEYQKATQPPPAPEPTPSAPPEPEPESSESAREEEEPDQEPPEASPPANP